MSSISILLGLICTMSTLRPTVCLTSSETSYFESEEIPVVPGSPDLYGSVLVGINGDNTITLRSNGIPDHAVGTNNQYPISEQNFQIRFPRYPQMNSEPTCLPANSIIGFATNGVAILSPFDYNSNDINIGLGDTCQGRTAYASNGGFYYYAQVPDKCSTFIEGYRGHDATRIYGVAIDGFPIYGHGSEANKVTNAELDACHGKFVDGEYRYYMTDEWPYVLGCFRGDPVTVQGAPSAGGECKFACNTDSFSNDVPCENDFVTRVTMRPPTLPPTLKPVTNPPVLPPCPISSNYGGLTSQETIHFQSKEIPVLQDQPGLYGRITVNIGLYNDVTITLRSNGIPDHFVDAFPNTNNQYPIREQNFEMTFPRCPTINYQPTCLPANSIIGFATNGVPILSPFDYNSNDVNVGLEGICQGRTAYASNGGFYYYAQVPDLCASFTDGVQGHDLNEIHGIALDGFPIYGPGSGAYKVTNAELDACHGKFVNGKYRYYMTDEWPYVLGCFRGAPAFVQNAPFAGECKFACNTDSLSNNVACENDFETRITMRPPTLKPVTNPPVLPPCPISSNYGGLTSQETIHFQSKEIPVIQDQPGLYGRITVDIGLYNDVTITLRSNGIPDHFVGAFPNTNNQYPIRKQNFEMTIPRCPIINYQPTCLPANSIIGFATNGVPILSPFDYNSNDVNIGLEDICQGRTASASNGGFYYYAQVPDLCASFIDGFLGGHDSTEIYGIALDGFPIYGPGIGAYKVTNAELDACHGKFVDGKYRYYMTDEWPYVLGCFRGAPVSVQNAPAGGECKFACNTDSLSNNVPCENDFETRITMRPPTPPPPSIKGPDTDPPTLSSTTPKAYTVPALVFGILDDDVAKFSSRDDQIEQNTMLKGYTEMKINIDDTFTLISNGIPDHATAPYPNADNPYGLQQQDFELTIPRYPVFNEEPTCLPSSGIIGFATNGVALFSPYDVNDQDVNLNGTFDLCKGRTSPSGIYQYSQLPNKYCTFRNTNENEIYGVSIDGFPIYGPGDPPVDNTDLDICHGRFVDGQYRYYMTKEFPYILGCFRGKPQKLKRALPSVDISNCRFACNIDTTTTANEEGYCENRSVSIFCYSVMSILLPVGMLFAFFL